MNVEIGLLVSQALAFLIMLWVLKYFAWKPLLKTLAERRQKIRSDFEQIDFQKQELALLASSYEEKLRKIEEETRFRMQEAVKEGSKLASKIQEEAHENARAIISKAQADAHYEVEKAQEILKEKITGLVVNTAEKLVQEKWNTDKDRQRIHAILQEAEK